jgi:hypothetical protein
MITCGIQLKGQDLRDINSRVYHGDYENLDRKLNYADIEGSPYLSEDLILGEVIFKNGDSAEYYLRYDIYSDEVEYLKNKRLFAVVNMTELDHIKLKDQKFVYKTYYEGDQPMTGYLVQLVTDRCNLYQQHRTQFEEAQPGQSMPFREPSPARFKRLTDKWYFSKEKSAIREFTPNNAGLKQISTEHFDDLRAFVKTNKLKIRKEEDLVALFEYYNDLLRQ